MYMYPIHGISVKIRGQHGNWLFPSTLWIQVHAQQSHLRLLSLHFPEATNFCSLWPLNLRYCHNHTKHLKKAMKPQHNIHFILQFVPKFFLLASRLYKAFFGKKQKPKKTLYPLLWLKTWENYWDSSGFFGLFNNLLWSALKKINAFICG